MFCRTKQRPTHLLGTAVTGNENQWPHGTKGHSPHSLFIFSAIKLKTRACDKPPTSSYWGHTDITGTVQAEQQNKSRPGNFFARDNAQRLHLARPTWRLQKCLYRNCWSQGEIFPACLDLCLILLLCCQPRLRPESGQFQARFAPHRRCPSFFHPRWFQMNSSCRAQASFPLNSSEGQALATCRGVWCSRSTAKIQQF